MNAHTAIHNNDINCFGLRRLRTELLNRIQHLQGASAGFPCMDGFVRELAGLVELLESNEVEPEVAEEIVRVCSKVTCAGPANAFMTLQPHAMKQRQEPAGARHCLHVNRVCLNSGYGEVSQTRAARALPVTPELAGTSN